MTISPRPEVELNSKGDVNSGDPTMPPPVDLTSGVAEQTTTYLEHNSSYVGPDNSSSVCLFKDSKLRVFDVVVYLTVDLVLSVLALFLGGALLIVWLVLFIDIIRFNIMIDIFCLRCNIINDFLYKYNRE